MDEERLLYLIEKRSPIYNYKHREHMNRLKMEKLWIEIANAMNCEVSECRKKWGILRNTYSRYLRKKKDKPAGSSGNKNRKKWYLTDAMSFLKDHMNFNTSSSVDSPPIEFETLEADSAAALNEGTQSSTSTAPNSPVPAKKSKTVTPEMLVGPMMEFLQSRTKGKAPEKESALFFKSLFADYEKLSSRAQRSFRLYMVNKMNALQDAEENGALNAATASSTRAIVIANVTHAALDKHSCYSINFLNK